VGWAKIWACIVKQDRALLASGILSGV